MLTTGSLPDKRLAGWIEREAGEHRFFHWPLAFAEVFAAEASMWRSATRPFSVG
jgi:hypothetical protein